MALFFFVELCFNFIDLKLNKNNFQTIKIYKFYLLIFKSEL